MAEPARAERTVPPRAGAGRPLDAATRAEMEERFGHDFSRVRVHTGETAGAQAVTVGDDIVFEPGRYAPDRVRGRWLLAHELAHVVQSDPQRPPTATAATAETDAGRAAAAVISTHGPVPVEASVVPGTPLRQEPGEAPPGEPEAGELPYRRRLHLLDQDLLMPSGIPTGPPHELRLTYFGDPEVDEAVGVLLLALDPMIGAPVAGKEWDDTWRKVVRQVNDPELRPRGAPALLYDQTAVRVLRALTPAGKPDEVKAEALRRKELVLQRVLTVLLTGTERRLETYAGAAGDPETEWTGTFTDATRRSFAGVKDADRLAMYRSIRLLVIQAFGGLADGTAVAFARLNAYCAKLRTVTFLGREVRVHEELGTRLALAEKRLPPADLPDVRRAVTSIQGANIRTNTNNPLALSEHGFGGAVDINPLTNPNVPDFPARFIEDVTGESLSMTPEGRKKKDAFDLGEFVDTLVFGTKDPALRELERLLRTSRELVDVFRDDRSIADGLVRVAYRKGASIAAATAPAHLLATARAARAEGQPRWRYSDPELKVPRKKPYGTAHDHLADLLYPHGPGAFLPEPLDVWEDHRRTIELIIRMVDVYERSFLPPKGGKNKKTAVPERTPASARALPGEKALPQLVVHGFLDIPPLLIQALRAPDGGNLTWLGASEHGTKDFMHFELRKRPPLW